MAPWKNHQFLLGIHSTITDKKNNRICSYTKGLLQQMEEKQKGIIAYRKKEITEEDFYQISTKPHKKNTPHKTHKQQNEAAPAPSKARARCGCSGTEHRYFSNCMDCGRILCINEGEGPCFHCGNHVFSASETDKIPKKYAEDPEFMRAIELRDRLLALDLQYRNKSMKVHDLNTDWFREANSLYSENTEYAREQYYKEAKEKRLEAEIRRYDIDLSRGSITSAAKENR